ncbi:hypothetical protein [Bacillus pinisoli]|uniref:hypothetical protein n=1 Tax=Bacillus pinisoli TaxID=2901866 RepID=UPI001FF3D94E|nr:hypothetical protein [Bacillus pinisoli]
MKNGIALVLSLTMTLSLLAPGAYIAKAEEPTTTVTNPVTGEQMDVLVNTDNLVTYQQEEEGKLYEYQEKSIVNGETTEITITKYLIENGTKTQVDQYTQTVVDNSDDTLVVTNEETGVETVIEIPQETTVEPEKMDDTIPSQLPTMKNTQYTYSSYSSGGSYIAAVRYITYSDGDATAIYGSSYKYTRSTDGDFKVFKVYANDLRQKEAEMTYIGGAIAIADAVVEAVRGGQLLSFTLIKTVAKKLGKLYLYLEQSTQFTVM